jgi:hypothetical protein
MKCIFEGKVLHMMPIPSGIVAAVMSDVTEEGKMVVEYRMISLETGQVQRITNSVYLLAKFGASHKSSETQVANHLTCRTCMLPDGELFTVEEDFSAKVLDADGFAKWVGVVKYKGEAPSDAVFDGKNIWVSFAENNTIIRMDPASMREELRIGGKKGETGFNSPVSLFAENDELFVSNCESHQIWKINTKTYEAAEYMTFEEPVYGYSKCHGREVVLLESGIYDL